MMRAGLKATIALLVAALALGASAQAPPSTPAPAEEASLHNFGDSNKACQEWTDSCRSCTRPESGDVLCSNIGIACQPKPILCVKRAEEKKPQEQKAEEKK
jgi:phospholipase/lecithinase/hemolysin